MGFFGAVFATMTLMPGFGLAGMVLSLPFAVFAAIALAAVVVILRPGERMTRSRLAKRVIMWSSIGEGVGLAIAVILVVTLGHTEVLLPATAPVVGLHFLPMAYGVPFRPFYALGLVLLVAAAAGFAAAAAMWAASLLAVWRDAKAKGGLLF